jgi:hypothetical protein
MSASRHYLVTLAAAVATALAGVVGLNLLVDPWGVFALVSRPGLNAEKPEQIFHDRLVKAHAIARLAPDALLLGTSRAQVGLDPGAPALRRVARRPHNAALSDGTPYEARRLLEHAAAQGPVSLVVVGLDLLSFNVRTPPNPEWSEARLATDATGGAQPAAAFADWPAVLLSLDAARASLRTVRRQQAPSYFLPDGRRRTETMEARLVEEGGARATLLWSERSYLRSYACYDLTDAGGAAPTLDELSRLLEVARRTGARARLYFSPSHARSQLVVAAAGHWTTQEAWKRRVTALVAASGADAELWDFSGADPDLTGEPVPAAGDRSSRLRWYWESSHFRAELGDLLLDRLLGGAAPAGFGRRLTPETLDAALAAVADEVIGYARAHPDEVAEIEAAARQELPAGRCGPAVPPPPLSAVLASLAGAR